MNIVSLKLKIIETRLQASLGQELLEALRLLLINTEKDKIHISENNINTFSMSSNLLSTKSLLLLLAFFQ